MKHADNTEHKMARVYAKKKQEMLNDYYSEPKHMDPAAYARFKKMSTDYSTKAICAYGDHEKRCDAGCLFWNTCIRGRHKNLLKGDDEKVE